MRHRGSRPDPSPHPGFGTVISPGFGRGFCFQGPPTRIAPNKSSSLYVPTATNAVLIAISASLAIVASTGRIQAASNRCDWDRPPPGGNGAPGTIRCCPPQPRPSSNRLQMAGDPCPPRPSAAGWCRSQIVPLLRETQPLVRAGAFFFPDDTTQSYLMEWQMRKVTLGATLFIALVATSGASAQGTVRGAQEGAAAGGQAAGPVGAVVGGAVGAATGTVNGILGVQPAPAPGPNTTTGSGGSPTGPTNPGGKK